MSVERWVLVAIPTDVTQENATVNDYVFSEATEFSHEVENELVERTVGRKKDWSPGVVEETISVSFRYKQGLKADDALLDACQNGKQIRFWFINKDVITMSDGVAEGHNATMAYVIPESRSMSVDDEEETIEGSFKVKFNSARGEEPKLPAEILDPSLAAKIAYETVGQETGDLEDVASQSI